MRMLQGSQCSEKRTADRKTAGAYSQKGTELRNDATAAEQALPDLHSSIKAFGGHAEGIRGKVIGGRFLRNKA